MEWRLNDDGTWTHVNDVDELRVLLASAHERLSANRAHIAESRALTHRVRSTLRRQREQREQRARRLQVLLGH